MSTWPFRFIHAGDFHLERPLAGTADVPDHLRELFLEAPYTAAQKVFEAALAEDAKFVVLSGGILDPADTGPRGPLFLAEQFARLAERGIGIYWAGSAIDPPESWPATVKLPQNVHFFPCGAVESLLVHGDAGPLARLAGTSCQGQRPLRLNDFAPNRWGGSCTAAPTRETRDGSTTAIPTQRLNDFAPDAAGLYTIAVAHGQPDPAVLQTGGIHYWALGGRHDRSTPQSGPQVIHYCGTTQGRRPEESGVHGCTLVEVDGQRQTRTSLIPTDAARWTTERLSVDAATSREDLQSRLRERVHALIEATPAAALLISWTAAGGGPLLASLRRGSLAAELLQWLRDDYGHRSPAAWSVSLEVEASETLPPEWYEQEMIRGDFLRAIRQLQMNPGEPLGLERYLAEPHRAGALASVAALADQSARQDVLREAAALGVDLLSGEESHTNVT